MIVQPELDTYFFEVKKAVLDTSGKPTQTPILTFGSDLMANVKSSFSATGFTNQAVLSLSIEEEEFGTLTATLSILDLYNMYALSFRNGQKMTIKWGVHKDMKYLQKVLSFADKNEIGYDSNTEFYRGGANGLQCFITSSSHSVNNNGLVWNVSLRGGYPNGKGKNSVTYNNDEPLKTIVSNTCTDLLGNNFNPEKDLFFQVNQTNRLPLTASKKNPIIQNFETPMEFLRRLAILYNCKFTMFYAGFQQKVLFVGWEDEGKINTSDKRGLKGIYHYFDSGNRFSNILDGSGTQNQGTSGSIAFPVTQPDGKQGLAFSPQGVETTQEWVLNDTTVKAKVKSLSPKDQTDVTKAIVALNYEDFKDETTGNFKSITVNGKKYDLKQFFELKTFQTAPEGGGQEYSITVVPNPLYQIGDLCWLGAKDENTQSLIPQTFSTRVNKNKTSYYRISKISWEHSGGGVTQKLTLKR